MHHRKRTSHRPSPVFLSRKDVRLPVQLQRAMAAEAEAAREARAKVNWIYYLVLIDGSGRKMLVDGIWSARCPIFLAYALCVVRMSPSTGR